MRQKPEAICTVALIVINIAVFLILTVFGDTEDAAFMLGHGAMYEPYITEYLPACSFISESAICSTIWSCSVLSVGIWNLRSERYAS